MHQFGHEGINSYIWKAFTREQQSRGSIPRSQEEFINAVWGEIAVKLGEGHVEPVTKEEMSKLLEDFEGRIRDGMEPEVFKDLPEQNLDIRHSQGHRCE